SLTIIRYEYVKDFEQPDTLLPNTWIVVRIDGRGFHKQAFPHPSLTDTLYLTGSSRLSDHYAFVKPNDRAALDLMNAAAVEVMKELPDLCIAYGVSDEYSFVFHPSCQLFERRSAKLVTTIVSTFTAHYILQWGKHFPTKPLESPYLPSFDGRAVLYPSSRILRDYMSWRQVDCHINNLYNTTFWTMVLQGGMSNTDAEQELKGTVSADKNEILFKRFGINYNNEEEIYKKGSVLYRQYELEESKATQASPEDHDDSMLGAKQSRSQQDKLKKLRRKAQVVVDHVDIIKDDFWERRPWILSGKPGKLPLQS
ncbi:tRNAHis guanylyltransferase Thg1, partial [Penicillium macrosclerotiorum]|uniref:tRNAHis guanylyltransferase Thg1 n=1 Tax=Penicillium macrosclerotiorum TaxID=303699 RepID=UPI0025478B07